MENSGPRSFAENNHLVSGLWLLMAAGNPMTHTFYLGLVLRISWVLLLLLDFSSAFTSGREGATRNALLVWTCCGRSDTDYMGYYRIGTGSVSTCRYLSTVAPSSQDDTMA
jgi:hypothetical protein